ncbi:MAG: hypothetical protein ACR2LS_10895 [Thermomicrobiales bacterium]
MVAKPPPDEHQPGKDEPTPRSSTLGVGSLIAIGCVVVTITIIALGVIVVAFLN